MSAERELNVRPSSPDDSVLPRAGKGLRNEVDGRTLVFTDIWEAHAECRRLGSGYHVTAHVDGYCIRKTTGESP